MSLQVLPLLIALLLLRASNHASAALITNAPASVPPATSENASTAFFEGESESRIGLLCHNDPVNRSDPDGMVDRSWDRQMYLQGGAKDTFEVVEWVKDMRSNGWVRVGDMVIKEGNPDNSTAPGKAVRNLGGSKLDILGGEMAKKAYYTGPDGQEAISWLFEKDGKPGVYAASVPIPGSKDPRRVQSEGNMPRLSARSIPTFIPKGYHYVGFAYAHLRADPGIPLRDRVRAWYNRADVYLAVPQPGNGYSREPKVLEPYHYNPNVFPDN